MSQQRKTHFTCLYWLMQNPPIAELSRQYQHHQSAETISRPLLVALVSRETTSAAPLVSRETTSALLVSRDNIKTTTSGTSQQRDNINCTTSQQRDNIRTTSQQRGNINCTSQQRDNINNTSSQQRELWKTA